VSILLTGATGYIGGYVLAELLSRSTERVSVLVRGGDRAQAVEKLWRATQAHTDAAGFADIIDRVDIVLGDLHAPNLGLDDRSWSALADRTSSVLQNAATLNRMSLRACVNTNVRGLVSVLRLAADARVQRFSFVSAIAVAGERGREHVFEDEAIDWSRRTYDPYAETKRLGEHLVREMLPDSRLSIFRPASVIGDPRSPETTSFDMIGATSFLADMRVAPLAADTPYDVVDVDWTARAIASIHLDAEPAWDTYHLSAGRQSVTTGQIAAAVEAAGGRPLRFAPSLERPFLRTVKRASRMRRIAGVSRMAAVLEVFWPYVTNGATYDNTRVVQAMGEAPTPFTEYVGASVMWAREHDFRFDYQPLPEATRRRVA
jgi:thioester reductase-like protein